MIPISQNTCALRKSCKTRIAPVFHLKYQFHRNSISFQRLTFPNSKVQLSHEKRVQDSYKKSDGNAAEKAKEEIYRETIASQRAKRERFESQSKDGGKSSERAVQRNIYVSIFPNPDSFTATAPTSKNLTRVRQILPTYSKSSSEHNLFFPFLLFSKNLCQCVCP